MPVALEIDALDPVSGVRVTLRVAGGDDPRLTGLNDQRWWPALLRAPSLSKQAWDGDYTGEIEIGAAAFEVSLWALSRLDPLAARYRWAAAPVRIYAGVAGTAWASWTQVFVGYVDGYDIDAFRLKLSAKVDTAPFEVPALTATYDGSAGAGGGDNLKNKVKPLALGRCRNVEPVLVDATYNIYQVSAYSVNAIPMVYERAAEFTPTDLPGNDYPDHAALQAAIIAGDVPGGTFATCVSEGKFALGAPAAGLITADVEGDNVSGYVRSTADIIQRLCDIAGVPSGSISATSLANLEADVPEPINLYLTEATPLLDVIQRLVRPCNASAGVSWLGKLYVARFGAIPVAPTLTLDAQGRQLPPVISVAEAAVSPPYWRIEMGGDRSWRVHSREEIAIDSGGGEQTFYRRAFTLPATPTGSSTPPTGWSTDRSALSAPLEYGAEFYLGPISDSGPVYAVKFVDGVFGTPYLDDQDYVGAALLPPNKFTPYNSTTPNPQADLIDVATHEVTRDAGTPTHFESVSGIGSVPFPDTFAWTWFPLANGFDIEFEIMDLGTDANGIEAWVGVNSGTPILAGAGVDTPPVDFGFWFKQAGVSRFEHASSTGEAVHIVADSVVQTASQVGLDKGGVDTPWVLTKYRMTYDGFVVGFYIDGFPVCHSASFFQDFVGLNLVMALASPGSRIRVTRFQEVPLANRPGIDAVQYISGPIHFESDRFAIYMPNDDNDAGNASAFHEVHFEPTNGAVVWDFIVENDEIDLWAGLYSNDTTGGYGDISIRFYGDGTYQVYRNGTGAGITALPAATHWAVRLSYDGSFVRCYLNGTLIAYYAATLSAHYSYRVLNLRRSYAYIVNSRFAVSPLLSTQGVAPSAISTAETIPGLPRTFTQLDMVTRNGFNAQLVATNVIDVPADASVSLTVSVNMTRLAANQTLTISLMVGYYLTGSGLTPTAWFPRYTTGFPDAQLSSNGDTVNIGSVFSAPSASMAALPPGNYTFEAYVVVEHFGGAPTYTIELDSGSTLERIILL